MIPSINDDEVFELTNIKVREVSLVDRAANKRKFLVTKRDKKGSKAEVTSDDAAQALAKAQESLAGTPAAELDRKDAEAAAAAKTETTPVAPALEAVVVATETVAEPAAVTAPVVVAEPAIEAAKAVVVKDETVYSDGNVEIIVATPAASFAETPAEQLFQEKMTAAWLGAIAAVQNRLDMMKEEAAKPLGFPAGHIWYLKEMLECMFDIGGAEWDIETAAIAAAKAEGKDVSKREHAVNKIGRAISASRMTSLKGVHKSLKAAYTDMSGIMSDLSKDSGNDTTTKSEPAVVAPVVDVAPVVTPAVVAPAVVAAPVFDITQDPAFKALQVSLQAQAQMVAAQALTVATLKSTVATQEQALAKARSTVKSNALTDAHDSQHNDNVRWERDMASPSRFRR